LKVVSVTLPPLRDRGEDITLLADHFLAEANSSNSRAVKGFSEGARAEIKKHRWEGNIRELKHRVEQAVILSNNEYLSTEDLNMTSGGGEFRTLEAARDLFEKSYVVQGLSRHEYNVTHTARELGISRQHLQNLIKKHGITKFTDTGD
jgi:DNA-binding NtrC family response regulator